MNLFKSGWSRLCVLLVAIIEMVLVIGTAYDSRKPGVDITEDVIAIIVLPLAAWGFYQSVKWIIAGFRTS